MASATLLSSGGGFLYYEVIVPQLDEKQQD